jgi:glutathione S-transferase
MSGAAAVKLPGDSAVEVIEHGMLRGPWVKDDRYTICDMYLFNLAQWLEADGVDPSRFPGIADHRRRMSEDPVVRRVTAVELGKSRAAV